MKMIYYIYRSQLTVCIQTLIELLVLPAGGQDLMYPVQWTTTYWGSPSLAVPKPFLR